MSLDPRQHRDAPDPVPAGTRAPQFTLRRSPDQLLSLSDLRGNPVVLVFYPADWSPGSGDELALFNALLPEFDRFGARVVGLSVDGAWCHRAYAEARDLRFPLLADFEPKGAVAQAYGVYRRSDGTSERARFVLDGEGVVRWNHVAPNDEIPDVDGVLRALESLATGVAP